MNELMRLRAALLVFLVFGCNNGKTTSVPKTREPTKADTVPTDNPNDFWSEIAKIDQPIGDGGRVYYPYSLRGSVLKLATTLKQPLNVYARALQSQTKPARTEIALFLIASTDDARADDLLVAALEKSHSRARAAYLLGAIGGKGWPKRQRDTARILTALAPHVHDNSAYHDPYYTKTSFQVGDFVKAAYIRIAGVDKFPQVKNLQGLPDDPTGHFIGLELPTFTAADRSRLDAAVDAYRQRKP